MRLVLGEYSVAGNAHTCVVPTIQYYGTVWCKEKEATGTLLGQLKSDRTGKLAKHLYAAGITYSQAKSMHKESKSYETFSDSLKSAGARYKPWHENLFSLLKKNLKSNYNVLQLLYSSTSHWFSVVVIIVHLYKIFLLLCTVYWHIISLVLAWHTVFDIFCIGDWTFV